MTIEGAREIGARCSLRQRGRAGRRNAGFLFATATGLLLAALPVMAGPVDRVGTIEGAPPPSAATEPGPESAAQSGRWRLSIGVQRRTFGDVDFTAVAPSRSAAAWMPMFSDSASRRDPPGIGPADRLADRRYDDGHVGVDEGTADDGLTWNWGYVEASQVQGDSLRFRRGGGSLEVAAASPSALADSAVDWSREPDDSTGPVLRVDYAHPIRDGLTIGGAAGLSHAGFDVERRGFTSFQASEERVRYDVAAWDRFDLGGVIPPAPPYEGSAEGPGPLLPNRPAERGFARSENSRESIVARNRIDERLDLDLVSLGLDGQVEVRSDRVHASLAAGLGLHLADWEASRREVLQVRQGGRTTTVREWNERADDTDLLLGFHLRAAAGVRLSERVLLEAFGQFDWCEELEGRVGPTAFRADLDGWSGGVMIGFRF